MVLFRTPLQNVYDILFPLQDPKNNWCVYLVTIVLAKYFRWDPRLTCNPCLAETTAVSVESETRFHILPRSPDVFTTTLLVVPVLGQGPCRATIHAFAASPIHVPEAICAVVVVGPLRGGDVDPGDDRS